MTSALVFSVCCALGLNAVVPGRAAGGLPPVREYDDVRNRDLRAYDFSKRPSLIPTLWFNTATRWPGPDKLPPGVIPGRIMEKAKNPGLGVRALHARGITGAGITVAIIDQPMSVHHPQFDGKIVAYKDFDRSGAAKTSMHGPAVASLLVGKTIGTAPGAKLYFAAVPSWLLDAAYYQRALDWLISVNNGLPRGQKIRVVSVSAAPSGPQTPYTKNTRNWEAALKRAKAAGILVLDCTENHGLIASCYLDARYPENVKKCRPGYPGYPPPVSPGRILSPSSPRSQAEEWFEGVYTFQFTGRGGLSWSIPYVAGVLALGWQVNPRLSNQAILDLLFASAYVPDAQHKIINPPEFLRRVGETLNR
jgi:serine protease AprX